MSMIRTANQDDIIKIYLAGFLRAPEMGGYDHWSRQLAAGDSIEKVANTIFNLPIVQGIYPLSLSDSDFVGQIYQNVFGRTADATGQAYWLGQLAAGKGRGKLVLDMIDAGLNTADGTPGKAYITNRYIGAQYAVEQQHDSASEINPEALRAAMAGLDGTPASLTGYSNTIKVLAQGGGMARLIYSTSTLLESPDNDGSIAAPLLITVQGDTFKGAIGAKLGSVANVPAGLTASLVKTSDLTATLTLTGKAASHLAASSTGNLTVTFSAADFNGAGSVVINGLSRNDIAVRFHDASLAEAGGTLTGQGILPSTLAIDLASDTLTLNGKAVALQSGQIANATHVDLSATAPAASATPGKGTVTITTTQKGDAQNNTLAGSGYGGLIEGRGGDDTLIAGAGIDRIKLAATAGDNGNDTIRNFTLGTGGDILDFSAFLNKTGTANLTARDAADPASIGNPWANGDVLTVQGNALSTPVDIAALFGSGLTYAAPTNARKAVLISTDLTGHASIWYITNQTDVTQVTDNEIQQVGTLENINNILLVGFVAGNFA